MFLEFARFLESPSRATYLAARSAWLQSGGQSLHPAELTELAALLEQGDATGVIEMAHGWQSRGALSPRVHYLTAQAHELRGEIEQAELERWVFQACLQGILATGSGTKQKPYVITQISDEYDVLQLRGVQSIGQRAVQRGRKTCDVLSCSDGNEIWFEIGDLMRVPAEAVPSRAKVAARKPAKVTRTTRRTSGRLKTAPR